MIVGVGPKVKRLQCAWQKMFRLKNQVERRNHPEASIFCPCEPTHSYNVPIEASTSVHNSLSSENKKLSRRGLGYISAHRTFSGMAKPALQQEQFNNSAEVPVQLAIRALLLLVSVIFAQ
jgi:hypothetical protein